MSETRKLRFQNARGYNGVIIARGALIDVTEPWASRFIADGTAVEENAAPKKTADSGSDETQPAAKGKGKKKHG